MRKSILFFLVVSFLSSLSLALADVTYEEETKMGGLMKVMMMGRGSKSTTRVSGDFMRTDHDDEATIVDLNGERIIRIDNKKKTYSVMTFAEMKKKMEQAVAAMKSKQAEASKDSKNGQQDVSMGADVKVTETGRKETIQGMDCKQFLMDMGLTVTNEKEKQSGRMSTLMEVWQAKDVPGQQEVRAFYRKMGQKLGTMSIGAQMFQGGQKGQQPMMQMDVQKMADEMKKMDGHTMRSVMYVGDPEAARKEAMGEKPEGGGGGGIGGLGGMLKKMKPGQSNEQPAEGSQGQQSPGGVMMKMTTETTKIDTNPIDPKLFQIPSGYKEVQAETP